jgi:hypothetical protein
MKTKRSQRMSGAQVSDDVEVVISAPMKPTQGQSAAQLARSQTGAKIEHLYNLPVAALTIRKDILERDSHDGIYRTSAPCRRQWDNTGIEKNGHSGLKARKQHLFSVLKHCQIGSFLM